MLHSAFAKPQTHSQLHDLLFPRKESCIPLRPRRIRALPSLQATRAQIGKHALRIAIPIARSSAFTSTLETTPYRDVGANSVLSRLGSRRLEHMTSSSPNIVPRGTGGEPTRRTHMETTHTQINAFYVDILHEQDRLRLIEESL